MMAYRDRGKPQQARTSTVMGLQGPGQTSTSQDGNSDGLTGTLWRALQLAATSVDRELEAGHGGLEVYLSW